ncbi:MAG TPA: M48 family metallopeptidase [Candidatus Acidoferrum sp.]|nr:M48 family metallopeptidase [Candidatus Acidoferrum sp.]
MKKSFSAQCLAAVLASSLLAMPELALGQQIPQTAQPQQPPMQTTQPAPKETPSTVPAQQGAKAQPQTAPAERPLPQEQDPKVKPGSIEDVNAIGNRDVGKGLDFYSLEHEIALGKQLAQQVDRSAKFIDDPVVNEYVNRVGQNLVRNSDARVPFTIKVIDSDVVNAFALPGGFFYVNSGLILHADEEAEMAGVMAHEIAHVCARHGTKQATKGDITQLAMIPAMIFIPYTWAGYAIYQGMNFMIPLTFLKFTRDEERQADYLGLQYMYKAGYDPNAFVSFFEKVEAIEKKQPGTIPKIFSDHPPTPDRVESIQKEIATILPARDEYIVTTSEFDIVKARLQMIESGQKLKDKNPNKPTLRKRTAQNKGGDTAGDQTSPDSDRPTLKRRPDDQQPQQ